MARFRGTRRNDTLLGSDKDDKLRGFGGDDLLFGERGDDKARAGSGNDSVQGGFGDDTLRGEGGNDTLRGGEGDDVLWSGAGTGTDLVGGGVGDDTFFLRNTRAGRVEEGGRIVVEDVSGIDTINLSRASGSVVLDLETGGEVGGRKVVIAGGRAVVTPIDLVFSQDLSGSFNDDIAQVRGLIEDVANGVLDIQDESRFAVTSFVDKPIPPFGAESTGDYVYRTDLALTDSVAALQATYDGLTTKFGDDSPESQLEALLQIAVREAEIGFRADATRVVVLFTDATAHAAGDFPSRPPNNGDAVLDGSPPGTGEDYPSRLQTRAALLAADIIPIFAVTDGTNAFYSNLVAEWGFGSVVELDSDSANIIDAVAEAVDFATSAIIENVVGTDFADTLQGNAEDNVLTGGAGADRFVFEDEAGGPTVGFGNDTITDFTQGQDVIEVLGGLAIAVAEVAGNTIITAGPDATITVLGATGLVLGIDIFA